MFAGTPYEGVDPFKGVPEEAIRAFTATLIFKGKGLAHANYSALAKTPDTQLAALWASFGISDKLASDYVDYYCAGTGNCAVKSDYICTSNC